MLRESRTEASAGIVSTKEITYSGNFPSQCIHSFIEYGPFSLKLGFSLHGQHLSSFSKACMRQFQVINETMVSVLVSRNMCFGTPLSNTDIQLVATSALACCLLIVRNVVGNKKPLIVPGHDGLSKPVCYHAACTFVAPHCPFPLSHSLSFFTITLSLSLPS